MLVIFSITIIIFLGIFTGIFIIWKKMKEAKRQSLGSESDAVKEISKDTDFPSNKPTATSLGTSSNLLRILAGIFFSLTVIFLLPFSRRSGFPPEPIENYPLEYAFGVVLFVTILTFFLLWKKEHNVIQLNIYGTSQDHTKKRKSTFLIFCRILCGILALVFFIATIIIIIFAGLRQGMWMLIMLSGGYSILFLWIAVTGEKPYVRKGQ